jgi:hypothetical protein
MKKARGKKTKGRQYGGVTCSGLRYFKGENNSIFNQNIIKIQYHVVLALSHMIQGFKAMKNLEKKTFPSCFTSVSISTTLPGDIFSTSALKL